MSAGGEAKPSQGPKGGPPRESPRLNAYRSVSRHMSNEVEGTLTLLTRAYCHLCDEMRAALKPLADAAGARITEIDVDAEPSLEARYGDLVPVLLLGSIDGVELCHYRLDANRVRDALNSTR